MIFFLFNLLLMIILSFQDKIIHYSDFNISKICSIYNKSEKSCEISLKNASFPSLIYNGTFKIIFKNSYIITNQLGDLSSNFYIITNNNISMDNSMIKFRDILFECKEISLKDSHISSDGTVKNGLGVFNKAVGAAFSGSGAFNRKKFKLTDYKELSYGANCPIYPFNQLIYKETLFGSGFENENFFGNY